MELPGGVLLTLSITLNMGILHYQFGKDTVEGTVTMILDLVHQKTHCTSNVLLWLAVCSLYNFNHKNNLFGSQSAVVGV